MSAGLAQGRTLRDEAFAHLDASDTNDENALLHDAITVLADQLDEFSANDLPQFIRDRTLPNRRGRAFTQAIEDGLIEEVGSVQSSNPKAKGHRVLRYRKATS